MTDSLLFFLENYSHVRHFQERRTNANIIRDAMKARAELLTASDPHTFRTAELNGLFLLIVRDKYGIRFKQLDEGLQPSNNETAQSVAFQTQQMVAPDLGSELVSLNLGYIADWTELLSSRIVMVCPDGPRVIQVWEFGQNKVIPLPFNDFDLETQVRPVVRPKEEGAEHTEKRDS